MPIDNSTAGPMRSPSPTSRIPEAQARALDRRLRLHSQMQLFRGPSRVEPAAPQASINEPVGPAPE
jgi:hypothetical protein